MTRRIAAIVNPYAGGGKAGRRWPEIARAIEQRLGPLTPRCTDASGHGTELARQLLQEGNELIIAAGGDGTISEVANGFLFEDQPVRPAARLGILPLGMGGDFQRTLGISRVEDALDILATGAPLTIDLGKATFQGNDGATQTRYFINLVSFGMGGDVAARAKNFLSPASGTAAFLWATFSTFASYRGRRVKITLDGASDLQSFFVTNIAVGNGRYHGGGMQPCPTAVLNDGVFEVTVIDYLSLFEMVRDIRILYSDNVYQHPKAHHFRAQRIRAESGETARLEIDGEPLGMLPLEVTVLPQCLQVMVSRTSPLLSR